jgi:ribonuclease-3
VCDGELNELQGRLGYRFTEPDLLRQALTHRSYAYEVDEDPERSYERLEFLGDALLGLFVAEWLYRDDESAAEGVLTRRKQMVVRQRTLARVATDLGLGEALRLSRGEEGTGGRGKASLLADVFEATLAAIFLDGGIRSARAFLRRHLEGVLRGASASQRIEEDYKTRLQEKVQGAMHITPVYRISSMTGPDHARRFEAEVRLGERIVASGAGTSRKKAEQAAAEAAMAVLANEESGS